MSVDVTYTALGVELVRCHHDPCVYHSDQLGRIRQDSKFIQSALKYLSDVLFITLSESRFKQYKL